MRNRQRPLMRPAPAACRSQQPRPHQRLNRIPRLLTHPLETIRGHPTPQNKHLIGVRQPCGSRRILVELSQRHRLHPTILASILDLICKPPAPGHGVIPSLGPVAWERCAWRGKRSGTGFSVQRWHRPWGRRSTSTAAPGSRGSGGSGRRVFMGRNLSRTPIPTPPPSRRSVDNSPSSTGQARRSPEQYNACPQETPPEALPVFALVRRSTASPP